MELNLFCNLLSQVLTVAIIRATRLSLDENKIEILGFRYQETFMKLINRARCKSRIHGIHGYRKLPIKHQFLLEQTEKLFLRDKCDLSDLSHLLASCDVKCVRTSMFKLIIISFSYTFLMDVIVYVYNSE